MDIEAELSKRQLRGSYLSGHCGDRKRSAEAELQLAVELLGIEEANRLFPDHVDTIARETARIAAIDAKVAELRNEFYSLQTGGMERRSGPSRRE
jgi:hypothetical protein